MQKTEHHWNYSALRQIASVGTAVETAHGKVAGPGNFQGLVLASE